MTPRAHSVLWRAARAICAEQCAFMGEPPCWSVKGKWPPDECNEPGCAALAAAALHGVFEDDRYSQSEKEAKA